MSDVRQPRAFYAADSLHTEVYDALAASIIAGSSVEGGIDFYRGLAAETGGPILDVGCGTGRVATALVADGHEVVGFGPTRSGSPCAGRCEERCGSSSSWPG